MDYFEPSSYVNPGLPKITTIPSSSSNHVLTDTSVTQTQTPTSASSSLPKLLNNHNNASATTTPSSLPTIDEVLSGLSHPPFSRNHFLQYLLQRHCLENLEFYLEIEKFLNLNNCIEQEYNWKFLFDNFIEVDSPKEINLPYSIKEKFQIDMIPEKQNLLEASKIVFDYLHENYVCFLSSNEKECRNYCLTTPVPVRRQSYSDSKRHQAQQHIYDHQGRCISPLSPSESNRTTSLHKQSSGTDDTEFAFVMSDDDLDQQQQPAVQQDEKFLSHERLTSNPNLSLESPLCCDDGDTDCNNCIPVDDGFRKSSISSTHSNRFGTALQLKNSESATSWKRLAKMWKWRRSSNSSNE